MLKNVLNPNYWKRLNNKKSVIGLLFGNLILGLTGTIVLLVVLAILFGIPITGITIFLVENGTLIAIVIGLVVAFKLFGGKK